jgi:hypothetical protein
MKEMLPCRRIILKWSCSVCGGVCCTHVAQGLVGFCNNYLGFADDRRFPEHHSGRQSNSTSPVSFSGPVPGSQLSCCFMNLELIQILLLTHVPCSRAVQQCRDVNGIVQTETCLLRYTARIHLDSHVDQPAKRKLLSFDRLIARGRRERL